MLWISLWLMALLAAGAVMAQNIETVMAPGKLIQGHAKIETDCVQCHVRFDKKAQPRLCADCHKEVGADVRAHTGYHGRLSDTVCATCHTDHKGRNANVVQLDTHKFDHDKTDYKLLGKHEKTDCEKCHLTGKKYREAAAECNACHKKDDVHKGSLGAKCADCHSEKSWKEARFDHDTTKFSLKGKHTEAKCADCHKDNQYKDTPKNCYACHRKADDTKGHKGSFGEKCDTCHSSKEWKPSTFNHDTDTKYVLRLKHRNVACKDCHTGPLYKEKLEQECYACHKKDDKHKDTLGHECGSCHTEKNWKETTKFDHAKTRFGLEGKHAKVECKECHKSALFREAPRECIGCHEKDDKHQNNLGRDCVQCHSAQDWKRTEGLFDHARTKFPLVNGHASPKVKCVACHKTLQSYRNTAMDCFSCHKGDDKHEGQLGTRCDNCHSDKLWKTTRFDHAQSRFPLTGRHTAVVCKDCHTSLRYKDAPRACLSCHSKQDQEVHKKTLGTQCETCHNTRAWTLWSFDHNKTRYALEGGHRKVACLACHSLPAPKGKAIAPVATNCVACHREQDVHEGAFGLRCEQCHRVDDWKKIRGRTAAPVSDSGHTPALFAFVSGGHPL